MNWRNRSTSLFQMLGIATSLAWSNAHTASRRRCLGIRGTLEIAVVTSQDAADPPLRYPACNLSVEPSRRDRAPSQMANPRIDPMHRRRFESFGARSRVAWYGPDRLHPQ